MTARPSSGARRPRTAKDASVVSIYDLATRGGVSPSTVSKALRDDPRISSATRARIHALAAQVGFTPNYAAQSLSTRRTMTIGLVLRDYADPYNGILLQAIESAALRAGYQLLVSSTHGADLSDVEITAQLRQRRVDGILVISAHLPESQALVDGTAPVVFIAAQQSLLPTAGNFGLVTFDDTAAAQFATQHLIGLGHRRIGFVGLRRAEASGEDRRQGYLAAIRSAGIELPPELCVLPTRGDAYEAGAQGVGLLLPHQPTAIVFYNDLAAVGGLRALDDQGIRVPADISVVGFDDLEQAAWVTPPLTTMSQPREDMGRLAIELLLGMINGDSVETRIDTACTLVVRRSTSGPPRTIADASPPPLGQADRRVGSPSVRTCAGMAHQPRRGHQRSPKARS